MPSRTWTMRTWSAQGSRSSEVPSIERVTPVQPCASPRAQPLPFSALRGDDYMQWTIGRKLYTCIGAVGVATAAMIGGGAYVQREISADVAQLATRTAPAMQDAEELVFIAERV